MLVGWPSHVKANSYINLNELCPHLEHTIWRKTGKPHTNRKKYANSTYGKLKNTHDFKIPGGFQAITSLKVVQGQVLLSLPPSLDGLLTKNEELAQQ